MLELRRPLGHSLPAVTLVPGETISVLVNIIGTPSKTVLIAEVQVIVEVPRLVLVRQLRQVLVEVAVEVAAVVAGEEADGVCYLTIYCILEILRLNIRGFNNLLLLINIGNIKFQIGII